MFCPVAIGYNKRHRRQCNDCYYRRGQLDCKSQRSHAQIVDAHEGEPYCYKRTHTSQIYE
nr:MAG TPA: hypothetical protein [Caudoviricetes sp.]